MNSDDAYIEVVRTALALLPSEKQSVLACMVVLHTSDLVLSDSCSLDDVAREVSGRKRKLWGVTQRHAAHIVASALTKDGLQTDRSAQDCWFASFASETPYELLECVPASFAEKVAAARAAMLSSPLLEDIIRSED
jgi:hypothetical protein